jgi:hypothetical protein
MFWFFLAMKIVFYNNIGEMECLVLCEVAGQKIRPAMAENDSL